jgi:ATP-binding cassette subfamily B protein
MNVRNKNKFAEILGTLSDIWRHFSACRKKQFFLLSLLALLGGLAEAISLGLVVPFLAAMAAPGKVLLHPFVQFLARVCGNLGGQLGIAFENAQLDSRSLLFVLAGFFIGAALFAGLVRLALVRVNGRFVAAAGTDLSVDVYRRTLYQPYSVYLSRNSSNLISSLITKVTLTTLTLGAFLNLITSSFIILSLIASLLLLNPVVTLTAGGALGVAYGIVTLVGHQKLAAYSQQISFENNLMVKFLQEGLGGIRDILLDGTQPLYVRLYQRADVLFRRANANITTIAFSPRYVMETVGIVIFAVLALTGSQGPNGLASALPTLGALALGAQRLLPALQQGYQSWSTILAYQESNKEVVDLLNQSLPRWAYQPQPPPLLFTNEICFEDVKFHYSSRSPWVLDGLSFTITKGSRVGFVGKTGSGKSTCLDLLMGLLEPIKGRILIDGSPLTQENIRSWQKNIAHVPQSIYLSDSTLAENIAFGIPAKKIDMNRVRAAAQQAQIANFIESSPKSYQALVGERGIRLSGGQRQRIGIARALYKEAQVLVFDEATSALDHETENAVMQSIESLSDELTIFIVAHRTSTLKNCTQIIDLGKT